MKLANRIAQLELKLKSAGSLAEYDDWAKENNQKNLQKLIPMIEKGFDLRDDIQSKIIDLMDYVKKARPLAKKMKEDEFPEGTRSSEGKLGYLSVLDYLEKDLNKALDAMNTRIG